MDQCITCLHPVKQSLTPSIGSKDIHSFSVTSSLRESRCYTASWRGHYQEICPVGSSCGWALWRCSWRSIARIQRQLDQNYWRASVAMCQSCSQRRGYQFGVPANMSVQGRSRPCPPSKLSGCWLQHNCRRRFQLIFIIQDCQQPWKELSKQSLLYILEHYIYVLVFCWSPNSKLLVCGILTLFRSHHNVQRIRRRYGEA